MGEATDVVKGAGRVGTVWGVVTVIFGVLAIGAPMASGIAVTMVVAVLLIASGVTGTIYAFKAGSLGKGVVRLLFGGITVVVGVCMIASPLVGLASLTLLLAIYFLADGLSQIMAGVGARPIDGWGWVVFSGVASVVLAVLIWMEWPLSGAWAVGVLVGIRMMVMGWAMIFFGRAVRRLETA
ncbi:MAG: HdeD family acid-resistance protein [Gammaproteobacteria bacterium]|nr:HdeD family acid-resistance protein [Gammaproteobacteria bacterium]